MRSFFCWAVLTVCLALQTHTLSAASESKSIGLRNPKACGLLISSVARSSEGIQRASLDPKDIEDYLRSDRAKQELAPNLAFKDRKTGKLIRDSEALKEALREGRARPFINRKTINLVGLPLIGKKRAELKKLVKEIVEEELEDFRLKVKTLGRPEVPGLYRAKEDGWELVSHLDKKSLEEFFENYQNDPHFVSETYRVHRLPLKDRSQKYRDLLRLLREISPIRHRENPADRQTPLSRMKEKFESHGDDLLVGAENTAKYVTERVIYFFPLPQDGQQPTRDELSAGAWKLAINTPIHFGALIIAKPLVIAIPSALANFGNSSWTAAYSVVISNWFSRSSKDQHFERLGKNVAISTFFTVPIYWAGRGSWELVKDVATIAGWIEFASTRWNVIAFNVGWRFFYSNSAYKWEQNRNIEADEAYQRGNLTEDELQDRKDFARASRSRMEMVGSSVATIGYLIGVLDDNPWFSLSMGALPLSFDYGVGHFIMMMVGAFGAYFYFHPDHYHHPKFNFPKRLELLHRKMEALASKLRLMPAVREAERQVGEWYSRRSEILAQDGRSLRGDSDLEEIFGFDGWLSGAMRDDPELRELIDQSVDIHRLLLKEFKKLDEALHELKEFSKLDRDLD
ncbi:MAG: hypothetical protein EA369_10155 [Bradymonadales bacterium]|nr:MAG: hypothetical protein EA369_10155 [Bradymonadales bacterium]